MNRGLRWIQSAVCKASNRWNTSIYITLQWDEDRMVDKGWGVQYVYPSNRIVGFVRYVVHIPCWDNDRIFQQQNIYTKRRRPLFPNDLIRVPLWCVAVGLSLVLIAHHSIVAGSWNVVGGTYRTVAVRKRSVSPTIFLRLQSGWFDVCEGIVSVWWY